MSLRIGNLLSFCPRRARPCRPDLVCPGFCFFKSLLVAFPTTLFHALRPSCVESFLCVGNVRVLCGLLECLHLFGYICIRFGSTQEQVGASIWRWDPLGAASTVL